MTREDAVTLHIARSGDAAPPQDARIRRCPRRKCQGVPAVPLAYEMLEMYGSTLRRAVMDILFVVVTIAFFAVAWAYTVACEKI